MASYVVPQVEIHQLFSEIPVALAQNQVAFVFGPNYLLHRFEEESERAGTAFDTAYAGAELTNEYPGVIDYERIDTDYTKLFAENMLVVVKEVTAAAVEGKKDELDITLSDDVDLTGYLLNITVGGEAHLVRVLKVDLDNSNETTLRVVIDEELSGAITKTQICEEQDGVEIPRRLPSAQAASWEEVVDAETRVPGIKVAAGLKAQILDPNFASAANAYGDVVSADLYLTYRELTTAKSDTIHSVSLASEVSAQLGAISPDNPLAQAVYNAALNAGGQLVRYMAIPSVDEEGWSKVLNAASLTKEVYFLVPVTQEDSVLDLVQAHVDSMSAPLKKRWRVAFVSAKVADEIKTYSRASSTSGKTDFMARVLTKDTTAGTVDVEFVTKSGDSWVADVNTAFKKDVVENDELVYGFTTAYGKETGTRYRIVKVLSPNRLRVKANLDVTTEGAKAEIVHTYTNAEKAEKIRDRSSKFGFRRMYNVFPSAFVGGGVTQTGEFAAACVAGLVSSCLPQQPVTNLEIVGIDDIKLTYSTFSADDLNTMASGGTFIVTQDLPGDQVYVRHQISTAYEDNNLNTAELSITKNLDSISFYFDDLTSPYIGKYNITPELIRILDNVINQGLVSLASNSYGLYGSQIILDGTSILKIEQDALLKDHVNCDIQLNLPYPFNHLVLKLYV